MSKTLIKNACITQAEYDGLLLDIFVNDGVIDKIAQNLPADYFENALIIDAKGLCVAPGLVDMHVHLREPGFEYKEDILSGSKCAAAGGITSLVAMPNTNPVADNEKMLKQIYKIAEGAKIKIYQAAAISKGLGSTETADYSALVNAGAIAFSDDGEPAANAKIMGEVLCSAKALGVPVLAHCEDKALAKGGFLNEGKVSSSLALTGIPGCAESIGTAREIILSEYFNAPVHICHVSNAESVDLVRQAKKRGVKVTAETCPHYFSLDESILLTGLDADYKMNPPLRNKADVEAVIKGIKDGTIDAIATDHAPHSPGEKSDFMNSPNGVIGMETSLAAGITYLVQKDHISLKKLIELMSTAPAKILSLRAGKIKEGAPADIVIFDSTEKWSVDIEQLHGKSKNTPYKNMELFGRVKFTFSDGEIVYQSKA